MTLPLFAFFKRYRGQVYGLCAVLIGAAALLPGAARAQAAIAPAVACESLVGLDLRNLEGAPSRVDAAEIVEIEGKGQHCVVSGYSASDVRFEVRLPVETWTGRFLMLGCGGYCGGINADPATNQSRALSGCEPVSNGEFVTASSDLGHRRSPQWFPDMLWALGNPGAMVDFAYEGMQKATLVSKAIIAAYYGQAASANYFVGCSDGGRQGLAMAQRYPDAYDGIVVGAPVIDKAVNDSMYHAWGMHVNTGPDGQAILTADKIPALHRAVIENCADEGGLIQDERLCGFDPAALQCEGADNADCLMPEQVEVVRQVYRGPNDGETLFSAGKMPKGSELAWVGTFIPSDAGAPMDASLGDAAWSFEYPLYGSSFNGPTGLDFETISYDRATYDRLTELGQLTDPNNPDLAPFRDAGGKMILWVGSADPGVPPRSTLNYYAAVTETMGETGDFLKFYMLPGVNHCGGGPNEATMDLLTPMIDWVEKGDAPDEVTYSIKLDDGATATRPVYPYPSMTTYDGTGEVNQASAWQRADLPAGLEDRLEWAGLENYRSGNTTWCAWQGATLECETR